jgi:hypothetical protein
VRKVRIGNPDDPHSQIQTETLPAVYPCGQAVQNLSIMLCRYRSNALISIELFVSQERKDGKNAEAELVPGRLSRNDYSCGIDDAGVP